MATTKTLRSALALLLVLTLPACENGDEPGPPAGGADVGTAAPEPAEWKPHEYAPETLARFARLLESPEWTATPCPRNSRGLLTATHETTGLRFALAPAGEFLMGSEEAESEQPVHRVRVPAFLICTTECTQQAWDKVGGEDGRKFKGAWLPIDGVSWLDSTAWCARAGLRLPSEAEWEYACRAGSTGKWCFGDNPLDFHKYAWFVETSGGRAREVNIKHPNAWGLMDVHGNLWEWCADHRHDNYEGAPTDGTAWLSADERAYRVKRGGSWNEPGWRCRSAMRHFLTPDFRYFIIGFRPAASLP